MVEVKEDLSGKIFGRLVVLEQTEDYVSPKGKHHSRWLCKCNCGSSDKIIVAGYNLKSGKTLSCGCLRKENAVRIGHDNKKYNEWLDEIFVDEYRAYRIGFTSNTNRKFYVNVEDYNLVYNYCWIEHIGNNGYGRLEAKDTNNNKIVAMTKLLGCKCYDHIDRNPLNNRRYNLRPCTIIENNQNRRKQSNNTSGIIGVCWQKRGGVWAARITVNKHRIHIGSFSNKEDAIVARLQAEAKYFGKFAPQRHLFEKYGIQELNESKGDEYIAV